MALTAEEKKILRASSQNARRALTEEDRRGKNAAISDKLRSLACLNGASLVLSYVSFAGEADASAFHDYVVASGGKLAFPMTYGNGKMDFFVPSGEGAWQKDRYGILSPREDMSELVKPEDADAVIVPCVVFDSKLHRMGWGGGYYDRYLPKCLNAVKIMIAFECQRAPENFECEPWDCQPDILVTENGIYGAYMN